MSVYPALYNVDITQVVTQYPYTETDEFVLEVSTVPSGFSYTYPQDAKPLRRFELSYPLIQRADVTILENFFDDRRGRLGEFNFVDDKGVTWSHCRFDMDSIDITFNEPNSYSVTVKISAELNDVQQAADALADGDNEGTTI